MTQLINTLKQIQPIPQHIKPSPKSIPFIPTIPPLHQPHLTMIPPSLQQNHLTLITVFLNPLQFPPNQHYHPYPPQIHKHLSLVKHIHLDY
ncbi:pantoate--beta-alanine ligase, partial [Staphylococcus hominis]|uniref:pantoate--beta-alanine ligase n=1 Tax=Staphylococcus hominis TaxID=1290 RepID=UPI00370462AE